MNNRQSHPQLLYPVSEDQTRPAPVPINASRILYQTPLRATGILEFCSTSHQPQAPSARPYADKRSRTRVAPYRLSRLNMFSRRSNRRISSPARLIQSRSEEHTSELQSQSN